MILLLYIFHFDLIPWGSRALIGTKVETHEKFDERLIRLTCGIIPVLFGNTRSGKKLRNSYLRLTT